MADDVAGLSADVISRVATVLVLVGWEPPARLLKSGGAA